MTPEILAPAPAAYPELEGIVTEDRKPVDSLYQEKLHRLLTESLFASWQGPGGGRSFRVFSNVGLFFDPKKPPLVPDVMLGLDVPRNRDMHQKQNSSYFTWIIGKPPDVVLEFVSDKRGEEETAKRIAYADIGVRFYAIFDPKHKLGPDTLRIYRLAGKKYRPQANNQLEGIGLGLVLWQGQYEGDEESWLRWCDPSGVVIPTGKERADKLADRADKLADRADKLANRADKLAERLRELGIDPDTINGS